MKTSSYHSTFPKTLHLFLSNYPKIKNNSQLKFPKISYTYQRNRAHIDSFSTFKSQFSSVFPESHRRINRREDSAGRVPFVSLKNRERGEREFRRNTTVRRSVLLCIFTIDKKTRRDVRTYGWGGPQDPRRRGDSNRLPEISRSRSPDPSTLSRSNPLLSTGHDETMSLLSSARKETVYRRGQ